jgi:hypothetical protein
VRKSFWECGKLLQKPIHFRDTLEHLSQGIVLKRKLQRRPAVNSAGLLLFSGVGDVSGGR